MPARSTAYYLLLKHTSQAVDSYCSFLDIQHFNSLLLRTLPRYARFGEGAWACRRTLPSVLKKSFK